MLAALLAALVAGSILTGCVQTAPPAGAEQMAPAVVIPTTLAATQAATVTPIPTDALAPDLPQEQPLGPTHPPTATLVASATLTLETLLTPPGAGAAAPAEAPVIEIPLQGPAAAPEAELSGLAWYGDWLVLLPQYPGLFDNSLLALPKSQILAFLDSQSPGPLEPRRIPLDAPGLGDLPGYEGLEAIAFDGQRVVVTVETGGAAGMLGYLVGGEVQGNLDAIRLDVANRRELPPQAPIPNYADESVVVAGDAVLTFYEANGANVNPAPVARRFGLDLSPQGTLPVPTLEYRVTDATSVDAAGRFWALNALFPSEYEKLAPAPDALAAQYGQGATHATNVSVERLVELQVQPEGIVLSGRPPIQLQLPAALSARNWEGLARLDDRGFLLATDTFPGTVLGFVAQQAIP